MKKEWEIPPKQDEEFVAAMERVLDVYRRPYDPLVPVVCMDEMPKQIIGEYRDEIIGSDGIVRFDTEYRRLGTCNVLLAVEPLAGLRHLRVFETKTKEDWARFTQETEGLYPFAKKITLICDNLNTHGPGSWYKTFPPEEAKRLMDKFEIVHTPKHGSWLDVAEIELSVLSRQCLRRRLDSMDKIESEANAWRERRNASHAKVDWQFTAQDARIKLKHLYPTFPC